MWPVSDDFELGKDPLHADEAISDETCYPYRIIGLQPSWSRLGRLGRFGLHQPRRKKEHRTQTTGQ